MNFQQLRIIQEAARRQFNLTEVANALFTSQSGVSKHIKDLEDELGVELFVRRGKRLLGLTGPGQELVDIVKRILLDVQNMRSLAAQFAQRDEGRLAIATTHTQARYALPPMVKQFRTAFPKVHLVLYQVSAGEIVTMLRSGEADLGVATEALGEAADLATFPFYEWRHAVIAPESHPLTTVAPLTLEAIAEYPIVTYHEGFTGRARIDAAFAGAGLTPDIVLSAIDADVIKTYVELGLGVGIVAAMSWHPVRDAGLRLLNSDHLFEKNTAWIAIRQGCYLRNFARQFIIRCNRELRDVIAGKPSSSVALDGL